MSDKKPKNNKDINQELQAKLDELTLALQRERADATNVRRRAEEEKAKMSGYFKASVIHDLLPFIDNLGRALEHAPKTEDKNLIDWLKGIEGVNKQLWQILDQIGVKKIKTIGEQFDPRLHEAVSMDDTSGGKTEVVSEEFTSGYILGDEVLRPAMVKVTLK